MHAHARRLFPLSFSSFGVEFLRPLFSSFLIGHQSSALTPAGVTKTSFDSRKSPAPATSCCSLHRPPPLFPDFSRRNARRGRSELRLSQESITAHARPLPCNNHIHSYLFIYAYILLYSPSFWRRDSPPGNYLPLLSFLQRECFRYFYPSLIFPLISLPSYFLNFFSSVEFSANCLSFSVTLSLCSSFRLGPQFSALAPAGATKTSFNSCRSLNLPDSCLSKLTPAPTPAGVYIFEP